MDSSRNSLNPGYRLHWYVIKKILGQGGFGITYLAEDTNLNQEVAIKEFLPVEMAVRDQSSSVHPVSGEYGDQFKWGLDRFMSEAQTLAKFKHPNIVRVFTVFPENNTAYMVMEYEHGNGMHELLKNKNTLSEEKLKSIILPILDGLGQVHAEGFIHRDIKPANIFIRNDGSPVLLDFGSARQSFGQQTRTLTTMVSPGFAPFEQYVSKSDKQGPWTDIYGLGATMYRAIIGVSPAEAMDRSEGLLHSERDSYMKASELAPEGYSSHLLDAIDHALQFKPEHRPQSVTEWLAEIEGNVPVDQSEIETVVDPDYVQNKNTRSDQSEVEKTEVLEPQVKKKPSLFRRFIKYAFIAFVVLIVLSILGEGDKNKSPTDEITPEQTESTNEQEESKTLPEEEVVEQIDSVGPEYPMTEDDIVDDNQNKIESLLAQADEDLKALRLTKPVGNNALDKYSQVLEIDPGNSDAQAGIISIGTEYLKLTDDNIDTEDFDKAQQYLQLAKQVSPEHPDIISTENRLNESIKQKESATIQTNEVEIEAREQPLISEEDKDQIKELQARVKENPRDRDARKELQSIMKSYEAKVKQAIDAGDYDTATEYIKNAQEISPRSIKLKTLLKRIEKKKQESLQSKYNAGMVFNDDLKSGDPGPQLVVIPEGVFQMGSRRKAREFFTGESPVHRVKIENKFAMGTKEVSVAEFRKFVESTGYQTDAEWQGGCGYWDEEWKVDPEKNWKNPGFPQGNNNPVVCVSWNDAIAMARWLSKETGFDYRLPTEAEWEYAARSGQKGDNYWGTDYDRQCEYENLMDYNEKTDKPFFHCTDGYTYTAPVAIFNSNAFGLYDMLGNVLEFTMDCFNESYRGAPRDGTAMTKGSCDHRMLRGGAWALPRGESDEQPTLTGRIPWVQNNRGFMIGFRLVRELN